MKKLLISLLVLLLLTSAVFAQGSSEGNSGKLTLADGSIYPNEPITIISGWSGGGNSDLMCQLLSTMLKEELGVNCNVSYLTGGDGIIALTEIAKNTPNDGYTMALCPNGMFTVKKFTQDMSFDINDFEFLPGACEEVYTFFVNKKAGFKDLNEMVAYYKNNPGKTLRYGMSGANGIPHLSTKKFLKEVGLDNVQIVSYEGGSAALAGCLGGEVDAICVVSSIGIPSYESGDLNAIVTLSSSRLKSLPDVKTLDEYGYSQISAGVQKVFVLPKGTNPEIVEYLSDVLTRIFASDEWLKFLEDNTSNPCPLTGPEFKQSCIEDGKVYWDMLEAENLLKPGITKPDFIK